MNAVAELTRLLLVPIAMAIFILAVQSAGDLTMRTEIPLQLAIVR